jgi:beta-xylosidase
MRWRADGWPVIGAADDTATVGLPVAVHARPVVRRPSSTGEPQTSDEFDGAALGRQWQWNGNPHPGWASLAACRGALRLAAHPLDSGAANLWAAPHLLLQKLPAPAFTATARLTPHAASAGETFGLVVFGLDYAYVGVRRTADGDALVQARAVDADRATAESEAPAVLLAPGPVELRATVTNAGGDTVRVQFAYRTGAGPFVDVGAPFIAREGRWVGAKVGLFALAPGAPAADVRGEGRRGTTDALARVRRRRPLPRRALIARRSRLRAPPPLRPGHEAPRPPARRGRVARCTAARSHGVPRGRLDHGRARRLRTDPRARLGADARAPSRRQGGRA